MLPQPEALGLGGGAFPPAYGRGCCTEVGQHVVLGWRRRSRRGSSRREAAGCSCLCAVN